MPDSPLAANRPKFLTALLLFLGCFCLYSVTMTNSRLGYEAETIKQAQGFIHGIAKIEGKAGLLDIAFYVPFVFVDNWIRETGIFWSFHGLVPNFALPFEMALTVALVFLTAVEIWPRRRAAAVAAVFAFGTMAWPYAKIGADTTLTFATALAFWGPPSGWPSCSRTSALRWC